MSIARVRGTAVVCILAVAGWLVSGCDSSPARTGTGGAPVPDAIPFVPAEELAAQFGDSVWQVETEGCDWHGFGSAFVVDSHHLVTNHHVIANDASPVVRSRDGQTFAGRVIGASDDPDVAVIEVKEDLPPSLDWADTTSLRNDEEIVVIGYPVPDYAFTVTYGSVVDFVGNEKTREAVLSNAPIDHGNSGGPALRSDGTVAGVVTQMSLDDPSERVAIIFTAATLIPTINRAIRQPSDVVSDCGLGPDYVPPVPKRFDISEPPPPPPPTTATTKPTTSTTSRTTAPPGSTTSTTAGTTSTTAVQCPSGQVRVTGTDSLTVSREADASTQWNVNASGTIENGTTARIAVAGLELSLSDPPANLAGVVDPQAFDAGQSSSWQVGGSVTADNAPTGPSWAAEVVWDGDDWDNCPPPEIVY